jgi:hypothetical protein
VAPGAAAYLGGHDELLGAHRDVLTEGHFAMTARWMDGINVRLPVSDRDFTRRLADKLARHIADVAGRVDRIVAFLHHIPFRDLLPRDRPDDYAFASAFMGAECLGEVLLAAEKVTDLYCGHSHWRARRRVGHITAVNVGSTYQDKRLEELEL